MTALSYLGVLQLPSNFIIEQHAPTASDWRNVYVGDIWLDNSSMYASPPAAPTAFNLWILVATTANVATWINFGSGGGTLNTLTGNTGGAVPPTAGNINVVGDGTTITVAGNPGTSTLTISTIGGLNPGTSCAFLAIQETSTTNATGDGTVY